MGVCPIREIAIHVKLETCYPGKIMVYAQSELAVMQIGFPVTYCWITFGNLK